MAGKSERADAARNREAILAAATVLLDGEDALDVSMQDIAVAAQVGKGTVFRRFGDRTSLVQAVIEPRVAALRHAVESGPPPLGPGAPAPSALHAYLDGLFDFVWANRGLIRALEHLGPHIYYANDASQFWIAELTRRISIALPDADASYLAHAVFTALRADVLEYLVSVLGMSPGRIRRGIHSLVAT